MLTCRRTCQVRSNHHNSGEADMSKDRSGSELLAPSKCSGIKGKSDKGNTSRTLNIKPNERSESKRKAYPSSMLEQTLASVAQQMAQRQKRGSGKQKHVTNCKGKCKNRDAKEPEQTKQVRRRTIIEMVRGKTNKKRPHEQSEQWTNNEISFPSMPGCQLVDSPIILEALIEGFQVRRIYIDGGSSSEVMYEHCFRNLGTETKAKLKEPRTPLVGFTGEVSCPIGTIDLNVTIGELGKLWTVTMEFVVVKSYPLQLHTRSNRSEKFRSRCFHHPLDDKVPHRQ
ncbi:hypothetical protein Tco_1485066 [Tanacetum coccineum]